MRTILDKLRKRREEPSTEELSPEQEATKLVIELVVLVITSKSEKQAKQRLREHTDVLFSRWFLPTLHQLRQTNKNVDQPVQRLDEFAEFITSELVPIATSISLDKVPTSGVCNALIASENQVAAQKVLMHFAQILIYQPEVMTREFESIAGEFEQRGFSDEAQALRERTFFFSRFMLFIQILSADDDDKVYAIVENRYRDLDRAFFAFFEQAIQTTQGADQEQANVLRERLAIASQLVVRLQIRDLMGQLQQAAAFSDALKTISDFGQGGGIQLIELLDEISSNANKVTSDAEEVEIINELLELIKTAHDLHLKQEPEAKILLALRSQADNLHTIFAEKLVYELGDDNFWLISNVLDAQTVNDYIRLFDERHGLLNNELLDRFIQFIDLVDPREIRGGLAAIELRRDGMRKALDVLESGGSVQDCETLLRQHIVLALILEDRIGYLRFFEQNAILDDEFMALLDQQLQTQRSLGNSNAVAHLEHNQKLASEIRQDKQDGLSESEIIWQAQARRSFGYCNILFTELMNFVPDELNPILILKVVMATMIMTHEEEAVEWVKRNQEIWNVLTEASTGQQDNLLLARDTLIKQLAQERRHLEWVDLATYQALIRLALDDRGGCYDLLKAILYGASTLSSERLLESLALVFIVMTYVTYHEIPNEPAKGFVIGEFTHALDSIEMQSSEPRVPSVARQGLVTIFLFNQLDLLGRKMNQADVTRYYEKVEMAQDIAGSMEEFTHGAWPLREWVARMVTP